MTESEPSPLIDLNQLGKSPTENDLQSVGKVIVENFQKTGYVYLKNHGLTLGDVKKFISASNEFFDMNEDFKMKFIRNTKTLHGYTDERHEDIDPTITLQATAARQAFDVQGMHEPFPDQEVPDLKVSSKNIIDKMIPTSLHLLQCLELGLGMKKGCLVDNHQNMMQEGNATDLKAIRYMPPKEEGQVNRLAAHCDVSTFTLQLHGDLEGLELLDNNGVWQESQLYPGYILMFPGELFEIWTGGIIKPAKHRVVIPTTEAMKKRTRQAVIFFVVPENQTTISPFNGRTDLFQPVVAGDYLQESVRVFFKALYEIEKN